MKAVDLFCGVGGLSKGLRNAGIKSVASYDNWEIAVSTYVRNLGKGSAHVLDLSDTERASEEIDPHKPDIIVGGPPCQDFSTAGHRKEGARANLTIAYATIVSNIRPAFALMENVPQVRKSIAYAVAKQKLIAEGYNIFDRVLDSSFCGVPQIRKRFFMFAWRSNEEIGAALNDWIDRKMKKKPLTVREYLKDSIDIDHYYRHPRNYSRRAIFSVDEPSPTVRGVNRPVPPNYRGNHLDSVSPDSVRPLTSSERSRVQTFPASWKWTSDAGSTLSKTDIELLIGNAVPVNLAMFIGRGILDVV